MAMDMYTLYGEAFASFLFHGALVFIVASLLTDFTGMSLYVAFAALMAVGSFIINGGLLTALHQLTCAGVKNVTGILKGAGVSAGITAIMSILPFFIEPLRLVISQIVMTHRYLGIPARVEAEVALKDAASHIHTLEVSGGVVAAEVSAPLSGEGVGSLPAAAYALQTFQEARIAASYLAAFAGAYGMALGAQWTSDCKK
jgi:hypothetical protein